MPPVIYKGTLKAKRKQDLIDIADEVGLPSDGTSLRDELESRLREYLLVNRASFENDKRFAGLYESLDNGERRMRSSLAPDSDASDSSPELTRSPRKHGQRSGLRGTPSPVAPSPANTLTSAVKRCTARTRASLENTVEKAVNGVEETALEVRDEVRNEVREAAHEVEVFKERTVKETQKLIRTARKHAVGAFQDAREYLSNTAHLVDVLLLLEVAYLVWSAVPTTTLTFNEQPLRFLPGNGAPAISISVPAPRELLGHALWAPLLLWAAWTWALPFAAAHLITFDRRRLASQLSFTVVRLALIVYLARIGAASPAKSAPPVLGVAAGEVPSSSLAQKARGWTSYEYVADHLNPDVQILGTATVAAFALYEAVSNRPRATS